MNTYINIINNLLFRLGYNTSRWILQFSMLKLQMLIYMVSNSKQIPKLKIKFEILGVAHYFEICLRNVLLYADIYCVCLTVTYSGELNSFLFYRLG